MNRPIDDDGGYYDRRSDPNQADREISLGTPTILGIFFGIALLCAACFGFGYSMGHTSARNAQLAEAASAPAPTAVYADPSATKPAAGSPAGHSFASSTQAVQSQQLRNTESASGQTAVVSLAPSAPNNTVAPSDRIIAGDKLPAANPPQNPVATQPAAPAYVVQVAAVSSQDVADILINSLEKKGYTVAVHHEPQDKLLHVQIGPFADRKEADAMQKRVIADGFNAIVK